MTENELLEQLAAALAFPTLQQDEVTAKMLSDEVGITQRGALEYLHKMERDGFLKSHRVRLDSGHLVLAFSKVED